MRLLLSLQLLANSSANEKCHSDKDGIFHLSDVFTHFMEGVKFYFYSTFGAQESPCLLMFSGLSAWIFGVHNWLYFEIVLSRMLKSCSHYTETPLNRNTEKYETPIYFFLFFIGFPVLKLSWWQAGCEWSYPPGSLSGKSYDMGIYESKRPSGHPRKI